MIPAIDSVAGDAMVAAVAFVGATVSGLSGFAFGLVVLGLWLYRRVNETWFRRIVLWLLLASGTALVI